MHVAVMVEGQEGISWDRWRSLARMVEDLGFESLWRSDHLFSLAGDPAQDSLDPFLAMTVLAVETSRIRFGTLVTPVTFRDPATTARLAAHVDRLSGGRLVLGIGAGWNQAEHEAYGIPFPPVRERFERLEEALQIIRALSGGGPASFDGRYYRLRDAVCHPTPAQQPLPVLIGGNGERRTLRLAARYADEWNAIYVNLETYRAKAAVLAQHCERAGRDPASIRHSLMAGYVVAEDERALHAKIERLRTVAHPSVRPADREPAEAIAALRRRNWLVGTPGELVDTLGRYEEAGVSRVKLHHLNTADDESLELVATRLLPQLQRAE